MLASVIWQQNSSTVHAESCYYEIIHMDVSHTMCALFPLELGKCARDMGTQCLNVECCFTCVLTPSKATAVPQSAVSRSGWSRNKVMWSGSDGVETSFDEDLMAEGGTEGIYADDPNGYI